MEAMIKEYENILNRLFNAELWLKNKGFDNWEDILNEEENEELEEISRQLAEFHYYNETNK